MPAAATVYAPNTAPGDARLADLGVPAMVPQEALVEGAMARDRCTPNHPPTFPGLLAWGETVRALRDRLAPVGWRRNDAGGLSTVVDAAGLVAIAVATGDEATGDAAFPPSTKYTKGPSTQLMIEGNQGVLEFMRAERTDDAPRRVTWLLLFRRSENEIRAELSLPVASASMAALTPGRNGSSCHRFGSTVSACLTSIPSSRQKSSWRSTESAARLRGCSVPVPDRLRFARKRRGLTKTRLAGLVGLTARSVQAFENGEKAPSEETLAGLARALRFPVDFFAGEELDELLPDGVSFRSMSSLTAGRRDAALGAGRLAIELMAWLGERFTLPATNVPDFSHHEPEAAAEAVREFWKLGQKPISNMVHLLEANGVRVFSLAERTKDVDAFSLWYDDVPYMFLNTFKSAERSRLDAAHELGHLCCTVTVDRRAAKLSTRLRPSPELF